MTHSRLRRLVDYGASFTCIREKELGQHHSHSILGRLLKLSAAPSLATDNECVVFRDILDVTRMSVAHQGIHERDASRAAAGVRGHVPLVSAGTSKQALSWATVQGAQALGLGGEIGRLAVGMRADLTVIDSRTLNLWPPQDPIATVLHASTANIEAVMINGRWRKRDGVLLDIDIAELQSTLLESGCRILDTIGIPSCATHHRVQHVG